MHSSQDEIHQKLRRMRTPTQPVNLSRGIQRPGSTGTSKIECTCSHRHPMERSHYLIESWRFLVAPSWLSVCVHSQQPAARSQSTKGRRIDQRINKAAASYPPFSNRIKRQYKNPRQSGWRFLLGLSRLQTTSPLASSFFRTRQPLGRKSYHLKYIRYRQDQSILSLLGLHYTSASLANQAGGQAIGQP